MDQAPPEDSVDLFQKTDNIEITPEKQQSISLIDGIDTKVMASPKMDSSDSEENFEGILPIREEYSIQQLEKSKGENSKTFL